MLSTKRHSIYPYNFTNSDVEQKVRDYIDAFNKLDLKQIDFLFEGLYQYNFRGIHKGRRINRRQLKQLHTALLFEGTQARLVYFRTVGASAYDMKIAFVNEERGEFSMRKLVVVEDNKIANSIDYNGTLASTKPNEEGYRLTFWWYLSVYLMTSGEEMIASDR